MTQDISLLILEQGAEWPSWATGMRMRAINSAVEAQLDDEPIEDFQQRVFARLAEIEKQRMRLRAAGYACAVRPATRWSARREMCERLLSQLDLDGSSELVLAGGSWETTGSDGQQRSRLIQLWSELSALHTGRVVSIRFEDSVQESGVFHAAGRLHQSNPLAAADHPGTALLPPSELL